MKRVLSIDGGGIRGIIPALICQELEERSGRAIKELFDLVTGTSTGGILALGYAHPNGISAHSLADMYLSKGKAIFSDPRSSVAQMFFRPKFNNEELKKVIRDVFKDTTLSQSVIEVCVTAYNTQLRKPVYLSSDNLRGNKYRKLRMLTAAMATSAAPTYLPPYKLRSDEHIDGGVVANNPSCIAYSQAKRLWPNEQILLLSIGTGSFKCSLAELQDKQWGKLKWIEPLIDCFMDGTSQATDDFFRRTNPKRYLRLQPTLNEYTQYMDDTSNKSLGGLRAAAEQIFNDRITEIDKFLSRLTSAGNPLQGTITMPIQNATVSKGPLTVSGNIQNYRGEILYAFTGTPGLYWPSEVLSPNGKTWTANLNVGMRSSTASITLAAVDRDTSNHIELYRKHQTSMSYCGVRISKLKTVLASTSVQVI